MKNLSKMFALVASLVLSMAFINVASADANPFAKADQVSTFFGDDGKCGDKKDKAEKKCGDKAEKKCGDKAHKKCGDMKGKKGKKCGEGKCGDKKGKKGKKCGDKGDKKKDGKCGGK